MSARATVTVLFCDVVGSTALLSRLGEEANDELRRDLFAALRRSVEIHGGEEVKSQGDGLMVAFRTSASDAVACAVAMHRAVARLAARDPLLDLAIRIGVATGEATHEEDDWFGTPVVQAARLCSAARPRQVLVTDLLAAVVGDAAAFRSVGELMLKGFPRPVAASEVPWQAEDTPAVVPLPTAFDSTGELAFVGRDAELAALVEALDDAAASGPRVVLLSGEAGSGKTRLLAELGAEAQRRGVVVLYGTTVGEALRWYATSVPVATLRRQVGDRGATLVALVPALRVRLPELVDAEPADRPEHDELAAAVTAFVARAAAAAPLVIALDDLHAADARTLLLLVDLATAPLGPVLVLAAFRTDDGPMPGVVATVVEKLSGLPATTQLELGPLDATAVTALVGPAASGEVLAHSGGNARTTVALARELVGGRSVAEVAARIAPYKGLAPLGAEDADVYFGREEAVNEVLSRLGTTRLVAVVGASGSGKSSLVRAGVLPSLRRGALAGSAQWSAVVMRPGTHPAAALDDALHDDPDLVVVDQLEEVFTLCASDEERRRFVDRLVGLAVERSGRTSVIVTIRADFYGHCAFSPALADALEAGHLLLGPMSEDELRAAVEGPAEVAGLRLEPGLADLVVADVAGEPGGLPLLSQAMLETWKRRRGRTLTVADYREAGGARGAIARTADAVFTTRLDGRQQALARSVLLRLTEPGQGADDTRRRVPLGELVPGGVADAEVAGVVDVLADARLLTVDDERVEVAHEALIREWPRLRGWIEEDREALHARRHLEQAAREWHASGREPAELYRGARLETIAELVAAERLAPTAAERAFIDASLAERDRARQDAVRRVRRLRLLLAGAVAALVVALVAGAVALEQRQTADRQRTRAEELAVEADARRLVLEASALGADQNDLAALLAVEARRLDGGDETAGALQAALLREHRLVETLVQGEGGDFLKATPDGAVVALSGLERLAVLDRHGEELLAVDVQPGIEFALSADGSALAYVGRDAGVVVAAVDGSGERPLPAAGYVVALALSPDGDRLAAGDATGAVQIIDVTTGGELGRLDHGGGPAIVAFSPDGGTLASFGADAEESVGVLTAEGVGAVPVDGTVRTWDGTTAAPLAGPVPGPRGAPATVEFSPDGRQLAIGAAMFDRPADAGEDEHVVLYDSRSLARAGVAVRGFTAAFDPSGDRLAVGGRGGDVTVVDTQSGRPLAPSLQVERVASLSFRPDGTLLTAGAGVAAWRWDADVALVGPRVGERLSEPLAVSGDGGLVAVGTNRNLPHRVVSDGYTTRVYDTATGAAVGPDHVGVALALDGERLVLLQRAAVADVLDVRTGATVVAAVAEGATGVAAVSGDGGRAAIATTNGVTILDLGDPRQRFAVEVGREIVDLALDRTGDRLLAVGGGGEVAEIDLASGRRDERRLASPITAATFTGAGRILIGAANGSIMRGDDGTTPFSSQPGPVFDLAAGSRMVASATGDGRVRLHDLESGEWVGDPLPTAEPGRVLFLPDERLVTRSVAGVVAWDLDVGSWEGKACRAAGRQLVESEWEQYLPGRPFRPGCGGTGRG